MSRIDEEKLQRHLACERIRWHFRAFGYSVDDMSDDEIEAGAASLSFALQSAAVTSVTAGLQFERLRRAGISAKAIKLP